MGEVYRATDTKLGREVALKVLPASVSEDPARLARFEREAQMLAALNHPNIAAIYGTEQGALVMELVEGENLKGPLPPDVALNYARQIAEGLEAAHEKGIIHRDLKPANIKVTPEGQVKLLDFGLAKATEEASSQATEDPAMSPTISLAMTKAGVLLGTAAYMSPEQARGKAADKRADIWAFGVVLYEMLTGARPFGGESVTDTIASVVKEDPNWEALPAATPPHIRKLLARCLRKDPKQRMQSIGDVRLMLNEPEESSAGQAPLPATGPRRQWLPWAVAGLAVVAAAAAALWPRPKLVSTGPVRFALTFPEGYSESAATAAPQAAPSPDGRHIAFVASDKAGQATLWVRPLASLEPRRLDKTEDAHFPFWSPDGQFIAFFADRKLKRVAVSGGSPQTLCEAGPAATIELGGGAWNGDGVIVFAPGLSALMQVPAAGGIPMPATALDAQEWAHDWPQFLPGGRTLLYFARGKDAAHNAIYAQDLGSPRRTQVLRNNTSGAFSPPGYLLFARESTLFAQRMDSSSYRLEGEAIPVAEEVATNERNGRSSFAVSANGLLVYRGVVFSRDVQLAWYDRAGKRLETAGQAGAYGAVKLAPDERRAAVIVGWGTGRSDTWIMDLSSGVLTRVTTDAQSAVLMGPWSPDSQRLAVNRQNGGPGEVTIASGRSRILKSEMRYANAWSPDGGSLLGIDEAGRRLSSVSLAGEVGTHTILDNPYRKRYFRFSPDGKWVSYSSDESGRFEVFVAAFPSFAEKRQVSNTGGGASFWRKDGEELLYVAADRTLMSAEIKTGPRLETGVPKSLFQVPNSRLPYLAVDATGDAQRFLVIEDAMQGRSPPFTVVLNWAAELKR